MTEDANGPVERKHGAGTYQMLWDCKFCGTEKLLGVTHRHCPNCGAAQDPERRYFPAEEDMVALEDHKYVGVDVICPACNQPNSAASTYCTECGADLATGEKARVQEAVDLGVQGLGIATKRDVVADQWQSDMGISDAAETLWMGFRKRTWWIAGGVVVLIAIIAGIIFAVTYRKSVTGTVTEMDWKRVIAIEEFGPLADSAWDDQVPGDAYNRSCSERQRGTRKVQTGSHQECSNVDQGDGSFKRECRNVPDYRDEPVYDDWCTFTVDRWHQSREVEASGEGVNPAPEWPAVTLAKPSGRFGEEREGSRNEDYRVRFDEADGEDHTCTFDDQARWAQFEVGMAVQVEVGLTGGADCDSLQPAEG